jgi:hypothetical protein
MVGESGKTLCYHKKARRVLYDKIIPFLTKHGKEIGKKASEGDELCIKIIDHYKFVYAFSEQCCVGLLEEVVDQYSREFL